MYDGRLTPPISNWQRYPAEDHIRRAHKHLTLLLQGDRSAAHLTQAVIASWMGLELRLLAANNGGYTPHPRCSRCYRAEPLKGQRWCRSCLTAYQRERRARMRLLSATTGTPIM
jgi:hypothetical protein